MKQILSLYLFLLCSLFLLSVTEVDSLKNQHGRFLSPEGILFVSFSPNWDTEKLKLLHKELLLNEHGEEIYFLKQVRVVHEKKVQEGNQILGTYKPLSKTITLFNGKNKTTVNQLSRTLSHEYGHHFADYWIPNQYSANSSWAMMRDLSGFNVIWDKKRGSEHMWLPGEIIAEEYLYFYGSQNKKQNLYSEKGKIAENVLIPFENSHITHPALDPKIKKYWEKQTGIKTTNNPNFIHPKFLKYKEDELWYHFSFSSSIDKDRKIIYMYQYKWLSYPNEERKFNKKYYLYDKNKPFEFSISKDGRNENDNFLLVQSYAIDPNTYIVLRSLPHLFSFADNGKLKEVKKP